MKSPFPGMDPYIEACGLWEGFHGRLIHKIDETLAPMLPDGYTIDTAERSYVVLLEAEGKKEHLAKPDVTVTEPKASRKPSRTRTTAAVVEPAESVESVAMQAFVTEEYRESFIEIYAEREERALVTCIEVLSPSNKRPGTTGWDEFLRKRQAMLLGQANYLEIDLLRGGQKFPMIDAWPDSPYTLLVCRRINAPHCRVWRGHFRQRLPAIPVPLIYGDPDLSLDLQPLLDGIYSLGRYHQRIDYSHPLTPRLKGADAAWVREQLKNRRAQK